jgi:hypothetical protein
MPEYYLTSCKECSKFHEQTGLCLLGYTVPATLYEALHIANTEGLAIICRLVEEGDTLANLVVKKTCDALRQKEFGLCLIK